MPDAIVLVSGGLDSATVLAIAMQQGFSPLPLTFRYGQRHEVELEAAAAVCASLGAPAPTIIDLDLRAFGGSALTADIEVPKNGPAQGIPVTYVPARNTLFLSYALACAEAAGAHDIFIGVNAVDYSGYPDCRPEFIAAFEALANLATREGVEGRPMRVHAPLQNLSKSEIIRRGHELGVDYSLTHSCYDPAGKLACGRCESCRLRLEGFAKAGLIDPIRYVV